MINVSSFLDSMHRAKGLRISERRIRRRERDIKFRIKSLAREILCQSFSNAIDKVSHDDKKIKNYFDS